MEEIPWISKNTQTQIRLAIKTVENVSLITSLSSTKDLLVHAPKNSQQLLYHLLRPSKLFSSL